VERVLAPGELEFETEARYRADGIPLNDATLHDIAVAAQNIGVNIDRYRWLAE